jgi:hypothetical protein
VAAFSAFLHHALLTRSELRGIQSAVSALCPSARCLEIFWVVGDVLSTIFNGYVDFGEESNSGSFSGHELDLSFGNGSVIYFDAFSR